jgi:hypothetical protein
MNSMRCWPLSRRFTVSKIRIKRHKHYKNWVLVAELRHSPYPAEAALIERLQLKPSKVFIPYPFPYADNDTYHYHLAFLVEAVELLPLKIDLAFDAVWRAFESFYKSLIAPKDFKLGQEAPGLAAKIDAQPEHGVLLDELLGNIPVQSCEYLIERILGKWQSPNSDYHLIWNRLNNPPNKHTNVTNLLTRIAAKYKAPSPAVTDQRKAAMLLRLALQGIEVHVEGTRIQLPRAERISFLINALLYTFRNDRFHGNMQPPFKSSVGTLQTYAHAHYCFIWGHFLFLFSTALSTPAFAIQQQLAENTAQNLNLYCQFYASHLTA